jgi:hypothetical protein
MRIIFIFIASFVYGNFFNIFKGIKKLIISIGKYFKVCTFLFQVFIDIII